MVALLLRSLAAAGICASLVLSSSFAQSKVSSSQEKQASSDVEEKPAVQQPNKPRATNHLEGQTSPYLLSHVHNPVDWYPWGKEALEKAKKENKPIFLSIGYSACHWCHVMERESFENEEIAKFLNEHFVSIKVDREERPDLDEIYMAATVRLNRGNGGWPMSVFLTPELVPFYAGTYYPPTDRGGMPGFDRITRGIHKVWTEKREDVEKQAREVLELIQRETRQTAFGKVEEPTLKLAITYAERRFDSLHGGFGQGGYAPKFPHVTELQFLLRFGKRAGSEEALEMASKTLENMARGGVYDQIGGGFHRYSVDREWLVPHFEKMLYDNSQLASAYLEAWKATGRDFFRGVAVDVLDYVAREMTSPEGAFWSTTDADSEGVEGKFFVWSLGELRQLLGEDAELAISFWGATEQGNFEGNNILTQRRSFAEVAKESGKSEDELRAAIERCKSILYEARKKRVAPHLDDKILSSWNGLMLSAFAQAARWLDGEQAARYRQIAQRNAAFLLDQMRRDDGRMWRTRRGEHAHVEAFLEDYAFVARGLVDLFEVDSDPRWLEAALALQKHMDAHFVDKDTGGYFSTADYHEQLVTRMGSAQESSMPSDEGVAAELAYRLGMLTGNEKLIERGQQVLRRHGGELAHFPNAYGQLLLTADFALAEPEEAIVIGPAQDPRTQALLRALRSEWPRYRLIVHVEPSQRAQLEPLMPTLEGKSQVDGKPAAWICRLGVCKAPITDPSGL
jgi:uncharacterized protein YyaL (SSP411 family)